MKYAWNWPGDILSFPALYVRGWVRISCVRTEYVEGISPAVFLDSTATMPF